jgi:hypothetical protein
MQECRDLGRGILAVVLCCVLVFTACSTTWIGQAEEIVAALVPAAGNVVALVAALEGKTVSASDLQAIQNAGTEAGADLQLIQSLITAYQKADASSQPGILNQIQSAIQAAQTNLQGLLAALHIKDAATQAKITAVVGLVLSEIQSLAAVVPLVTGNAAKSERVGQVKAPLSARDFVASYNATMTAKTGNADLDRVTAGLKIHQHGKLVRVVSFGVLK